MSRAKKNQKQKLPDNINNTNIPKLNISIKLESDTKTLHINPQYNQHAMSYIDDLYVNVREDYNPNWEDDHKISYYMLDTFDGIFEEYMEKVGPEDPLLRAEPPTMAVLNLSDHPVRDVVDLANVRR